MSNLKCSNCSKPFSFQSSNKNGIDAVKVVNEGGSARTTLLFTNTNDWYFYCSKECELKHYVPTLLSKGVTQEKLDQMKRVTDEIKKGIPEASREIADKMSKLQTALKAQNTFNTKRS